MTGSATSDPEGQTHVNDHDEASGSSITTVPEMNNQDGDTNSNSSKTIEFDKHGEITLVVEDTRLLVSAHAMRLACKPWAAMFHGQFKEADWAKPVELPDDDLEAMKILLNIVHLRFGEVPSAVKLPTLAHLSVLADKYDAGHIIKPWVLEWVFRIPAGEQDDVHWLTIAWNLGMPLAFERVARSILLNVEVDDNGSYRCGSSPLPTGGVIDELTGKFNAVSSTDTTDWL